MSVETLPIQAAQKQNAGERALRPNPLRLAFAPFDYAYLAVLSLLLIPAFKLAHLPFRMDFVSFAQGYWGATFARSAFLAVVLFVLGCPPEQTLLPALRRYQQEKARIAIALAVALGLSWILGVGLGLMVTVDALALAELMERRKKQFEPTLVDLFWPGLYLFWGVILIFALNSAVVGIRWAGTYDLDFKHLDWVLFHINVSSLSHWTLSHAPGWFASILDFAYYGLFPEMGAVLILAVILRNQRFANQFVRAMLIGYTIALLVFMVFPAKGPYFICPDHALHYPHNLVTFSLQQELGAEVRMLWSHNIPAGVPTVAGYFISFPCMHIALATICVWFLRPWKWICRIVLVWNAFVLAPAIILLEWHYMIGMFGGVAAGFLAIWLAGISDPGRKRDQLAPPRNANWLRRPDWRHCANLLAKSSEPYRRYLGSAWC